MPAGDLCSVSDVKSLAQITGTTGDTEIGTLVTNVSAFIKTYTNRDFASKSYSEIRDGSGGAELFLRNGPATAVTSLTVNGVTIPAQPADQQPGYFLDDLAELLCLYGYRFCKGRKNVRVVYTAGSATVPLDVAQACAEITLSAYRRGVRGPDMRTQSVQPGGGETFSFSMADLPATAKTILARWARVVPL